MLTVGTLTQVEIHPGNERIVRHALQEAFSLVQQEPYTPAWVAVRQGSSTLSVFDAFPNETARQTHLSDERHSERLARVNSLLTQPRTTEMLQILGAKLPAQGAPKNVTVGFLAHFEAKPGKEAECEQGLKGTLLAVQQLPATTAWFGFRQGPSTFGTLDLFLDEAGRIAHNQARWPHIQAIAPQLFMEGSLVIEKVDVLLAKFPG
ncbi:MAG TPA: hypothetical protein VFN35_06085 [Ktedonobacteraceae bacterium]|nr:hypothetical protein [Ktedonobacteraceae bacterium]